MATDRSDKFGVSVHELTITGSDGKKIETPKPRTTPKKSKDKPFS